MYCIALLVGILPSLAVAVPAIDKANKFYNEGKYNASIPLYKKAVNEGSNPALCYFNCANAYFQLDSLPQAIVYYRACLSYAEDFFRGYLNLAIAYYSLNEIGESIAILTRALELEPDNEKASMVLAASYREAGAFAEAGALFQRIIEEHPEKEEVYIALGEMYRDLDDPQEAINWLAQYPSTGKNLEYIHMLLADIYEYLEDNEKSLYYLQKVFEKNTTKKWVLYRIVLLLQSMGNEFLAFEEAKRGFTYFPDFAELALMAGNSAYKQALYSEAERYYTIASDLGSASALVGLENVRIVRLQMSEEGKE